jgi:hypothetical protein
MTISQSRDIQHQHDWGVGIVQKRKGMKENENAFVQPTTAKLIHSIIPTWPFHFLDYLCCLLLDLLGSYDLAILLDILCVCHFNRLSIAQIFANLEV